jgi:hypothetical protein
MKAARKQQHIMFPAPISFLDDELKAELDMKKKEKEKEEETSENYCSLKVPIDHTDNESKSFTVKVKRYNSGPPEEFLKWRPLLAEQIKNNEYEENADSSINLAHALLAGRILEAFINEKRSRDANDRVRKAKTLTEHTPKQIFDFALFELSIRAFDIKSGWHDAYERQRENMRRDIIMGRLSQEKFSQRLQDLNR